jgi:hypothetical protein
LLLVSFGGSAMVTTLIFILDSLSFGLILASIILIPYYVWAWLLKKRTFGWGKLELLRLKR